MTPKYAALVLALGIGAAGTPANADAVNGKGRGAGISFVKRVLPAIKAPVAPHIDGDLSDPCWKSAAIAEQFVDDQTGAVAPEQTTAMVVYDATNIYVAFHCTETQPDKILARETVRDSKYQGSGTSDDNVEVVFDPFQSHRFNDRSRFSVNAIGTLSASQAGGRANKVEWQGQWDAAVKRVPDGWTAEMRIPWKALNYPDGRGLRTMNINFSRFQSRTHLNSIWSNYGPQGFFENDGQWTGVEVPQGTFKPRLSILPYILTGNRGTRGAFNSGLDARLALTPQLTAIGSLNPDFSTVENALTGIQFSRSEQIAPESRPFFLEGRGNFQVSNINFLGAYFLPQRIPGFDLGNKLYGKISPRDAVGILNTMTFGKREDLVANFHHDQSATSYVDLFAARRGMPGADNTIAALTENIRRGKLEINGQWGVSGGQHAGGDTHQLIAMYEDKTVLSALAYGDVAPTFRDADGFFPFTDIKGFTELEQLGTEWRHGLWRSYQMVLVPQYTWHYNGLPYQRGASLDLSMETRSDWQFDINASYNAFDDQADKTYGFGIVKGVSNRFRQLGVAVVAGQQGGRPSFFIAPRFSVRMFKHLDIGYTGGVQNLDTITQQHLLTFNYELSPTRSLGGRFVLQNGAVNWYGFYRNSGGAGTNLYLILGDPNAQKFVPRIGMKLVFAV